MNRHERTSWGDGKVGLQGVCICQNSVNIPLRFLYFIACKFYFNKHWTPVDMHTEVYLGGSILIIYFKMHQKIRCVCVERLDRYRQTVMW